MTEKNQSNEPKKTESLPPFTEMNTLSHANFSWARLWGIIVKEFIQMKRDRLTLGMMVGIPLMQLFLFSNAINSDPKHLPTAVINNDRGVMSRTLLTALEERNPDLSQAIRKKMFTFEDLLVLDGSSIQRIMREIDTRDLTIALKKASEPLKKLLLSNISRRAAETVQEELAFLGHVKPRDVEAAQFRIIDSVRKLETEGEIDLDVRAEPENELV